MTELLLTTHQGLEALVVEEMRGLASRAGLGDVRGQEAPLSQRGRVRIECDAPLAATLEVARHLRSVHHVMRQVHAFPLPDSSPLEAIREEVRRLDLPELERAGSFGVRCRRIGSQEFGSPDVERVAGAAIKERHDIAVDLKAPDVWVRVDVVDRSCSVGVLLTGQALSARHQGRPYSQRTALKATVAWAALRLADMPERPCVLLDPFCGSATILLEAAQVCPQAHLLGSDFRLRAADGARENLHAAGLAHRSEVRHGDARRVSAVFEDHQVDAVVTNPPYGARMARGLRFDGFYRAFLESLRPRLVPGAPVVLLSTRPALVHRAASEVGRYSVARGLTVQTGGVSPHLVHLRAE